MPLPAPPAAADAARLLPEATTNGDSHGNAEPSAGISDGGDADVFLVTHEPERRLLARAAPFRAPQQP